MSLHVRVRLLQGLAGNDSDDGCGGAAVGLDLLTVISCGSSIVILVSVHLPVGQRSTVLTKSNSTKYIVYII